MESLKAATPVLRRIAIITLVGFLVVMLAGPVLTLAGALVPFALVGVLVYIPYRLVMLGREGGMAAVGRAVGKGVRSVAAVPVWIVSRVLGLVSMVLGTIWGLITFLLRLILPTLAGAIGGGVLGAIGAMEFEDAEVRIPAGIVIGAAVGLLAGALRSRSVKRVVVERVVVKAAPPAVGHA
jgi:hypothetical protein